MPDLTLAAARQILDTALAHGRKHSLKPLAVVVLDARGAQKAFAAEDGTSLKRGEVAHGKAHGALALGIGSRSIFKRAKEQDSLSPPSAMWWAVRWCRCRAAC